MIFRNDVERQVDAFLAERYKTHAPEIYRIVTAPWIRDVFVDRLHHRLNELETLALTKGRELKWSAIATFIWQAITALVGTHKNKKESNG